MSEKKLKRRKFLADFLFAGGTLTAAAFLAKVSLEDEPPRPEKTPEPQQCLKTPEPPPLDGAVEPPMVKGDVAEPVPPHRPMPGEMAIPKPEAKLAGLVASPMDTKE